MNTPELVALSKVMAHAYVEWVEGRMSLTQFVVDMAQHLVDLKELATRAATVPQGVSVDVAELVGAVKAVQFDVYELTTPDLIVAFGGKTRIAVVDVDSVKSLRAAVAGMTPPPAELGRGS